MANDYFSENKWSSVSSPWEGNSAQDRNSGKIGQNVQDQQMSSLCFDSEPMLVMVTQLALAPFMIPEIRQRKMSPNIDLQDMATEGAKILQGLYLW